MKRSFISSLVAAACLWAVEPSGAMPLQIVGAARIAADQVNLRKLPSADSPRLVQLIPGEEGDVMSENVWSDMPVPDGYDVSAFQLYREKVVPVLRRENGWIQIVAGGHSPWVKESLCVIGPLDDITDSMTPSPYSNPLSVRDSGQNERSCAYYWSSDYGDEGVYLGRIVGNVAVMPVMARCRSSFDESVDGVSVETEPDGGLVLRYGRDGCRETADGCRIVDLDKLTAHDFRLLMSQAGDAGTELVVYGFDGFTFKVETDILSD